MARSNMRSDEPQDVINLPRLAFERRGTEEGAEQDALHVHVYLPSKGARAGRSLLTIAGGGVALVAAFLAGAIIGGGPGSSPSPAELASLQGLAGLPPLPASPEGTAAGGLPMLPPSGGAPSMPSSLQQMLAQQPRVQPPPGAAPTAQAAPTAAGAPVVQGAPTRNAFGLEN